jgi:lipoprotein NlpI
MHRTRQALSALVLALALLPWAPHPAHAASKSHHKGDAPASNGKDAPADAGYRVTPTPSWVKDPGQAPSDSSRTWAQGTKARRDLLVDFQLQLTSRGLTSYSRFHRTALDSSTLREVSEPTIDFNPAFQRLSIHTLNVVRDGKRSDRLKDLRVEMLRREQQLEQQILDGTRTALLMLKDVRVGDVVELAYSIEGSNPIFEGRFSELMHVASDAPTDRLHVRIEAPLDRKLQVKGVPRDIQVERFEEGGKQVLRVQRDRVAGIVPESATPPWYKIFPAFHVSEYKSWAEVDEWAQRLFVIEPPSGEVARRIADWKNKQLPPEALLADVLRFVQDDIRYFSVSLGESSHKPKPAAQTLADRMGDCKDKVLLLNTLLKGLGFDARPALVSTYRNRGLVNFLPSHDQFDHVISAVDLDGQRYFLDATANGQGFGLRNRGYFLYGVALVVGDRQDLQPVIRPSFAQDGQSYVQDWDLSNPGKPAQMTLTLKARGLAAERWRAGVAASGLSRLSETMAGNYVRVMPGLKPVGQPELKDDRDSNDLSLSLRFEHPSMGQYQRGGLEVDLASIEMSDALIVPPEARRVSPFMLEVPRQLEVRVHVKTPRPISATPPPVQQITDRHFQLTSRMEAAGQDLNWLTRFERRTDEVLPADLDTFRDKVMRARQFGSQHVRLLLVDRNSLEPLYAEVDRRVEPWSQPGATRPDALMRLMQDQEVNRLLANKVLPQLTLQSPLASQVLSERAMAQNQTGQFRAALSDAQSALIGNPDNLDALEARGVAFVGLSRFDEASRDFERLRRQGARNAPGVWLGISEYMMGHFGDAETAFRSAVGDSAGDERSYALIWQALAADRQKPGQARQVLASELAAIDSQKWPGALLHYLGGQMSRDTLLSQARSDTDQTRLRLAEAHFYIAQQQLALGQRDEARQSLEKTVATRALPYREVILAQLEIERMARPVALGSRP